MSKKKTHEKYIHQVAEINPNIEVLEQYRGDAINILHKCKIDGYTWMAKPTNILQGKGCKICATKLKSEQRTKSHEQYIAEVNTVNPNVRVLDKYISDKININHQCKICGYIWQARPNNILQGKGCPNCIKEKKVSSAELKIYYYVKKYFHDAISSYSDKKNNISELDIYIPQLNFAIEYDGGIYHQNIERDKQKDEICSNLNIKLIRIREPECPKYESSCCFIFLRNRSKIELINIIIHLLELIGIKNPDVDFDRDSMEINNLITYKNKKNSLVEKFADIAIEWHPTKNGNLKPENVSYGSSKQAWWICKKCKTEYPMIISGRTTGGYGCPKCGREKTRMASCKMVFCIEMNKVFESAIEAEKQTGVCSQNIAKACKGKYQSAGKHPATGEKLHWYYVEDQITKENEIILGSISLGYLTREDIDMFCNK